jgi:hypothetical protein
MKCKHSTNDTQNLTSGICKECVNKTIQEFETMYFNSFRPYGYAPVLRRTKVDVESEAEYKRTLKLINKGWQNFKMQLKKVL